MVFYPLVLVWIYCKSGSATRLRIDLLLMNQMQWELAQLATPRLMKFKISSEGFPRWFIIFSSPEDYLPHYHDHSVARAWSYMFMTTHTTTIFNISCYSIGNGDTAHIWISFYSEHIMHQRVDWARFNLTEQDKNQSIKKFDVCYSDR